MSKRQLIAGSIALFLLGALVIYLFPNVPKPNQAQAGSIVAIKLPEITLSVDELSGTQAHKLTVLLDASSTLERLVLDESTSSPELKSQAISAGDLHEGEYVSVIPQNTKGMFIVKLLSVMPNMANGPVTPPEL